MVNGQKLREMALYYDYPEIDILDAVCKDLIEGADIGCRGSSREPSRSTNAPSAYIDGYKVTDAISDWVEKGFAYGPVDINEVPEKAKVSGIMTKAKPNGSVRVILNLSAPVGNAVNDGIVSDDFPTKMSSTTEWINVLNRAGRSCLMCKVDWSDAYKHIAVRDEDTDLQWFEWLGKFFKELCLIFGGRSSAGLFDRLAKIVLYIVIRRSGICQDSVIQHLDDCCAAAPKGSKLLDVFDNCFKEVASELGIKLAPRDDPEKSFGPRTWGVVLGVFYDTENWTWGLPQEKLLRLLHQIDLIQNRRTVRQDEIWSLTGRILNVKPLVPLGRFHISNLMTANRTSTNASDLVEIKPELITELQFWKHLLPICSGLAPIPNPQESLPDNTIEVYTDAAGGSWREPGKGVGAVTEGWWAYLAWARAINVGKESEPGRKLDRAMSALELLGPLLVITAGHQWCKNKPIRVWVDNIGAVCIWKKGYSSSCNLSSTIVKACATIAAGLNCRFEIEKITRCSSIETDMADALSKADFNRFWNLEARSNLQLPLDWAEIPSVLLKWCIHPKPDLQLGDRILEHLAKSTSILGYSQR